MPWKQTDPVKERVRFIETWQDSDDSFSDLCVQFGISRQKCYKWVERFEAGGLAALEDQSRRPLTNSRAVLHSTVELIVALRKERPRWGPKKILAVLERDYPRIEFPVASTVGAILKANGLVTKRRRRPSTASHETLGGYDSPNAVWCADFKGEFLVGSRYCHPLTISDGYSRYVLGCIGLRRTLHDVVKRAFIEVFEEHGLPDAIRTDNGPPFVSVTVGGLSRLAVWWTLLGVRPERILPGRPDQNGRHERMHRTLKAETAKPPKTTFLAQQRAFDEFRDDYNHRRPHEALGQQTPASLYVRSRREYTGELVDPEYPSHFHIQRAYPNGVITFGQTQWYLSNCLANQRIGIESIEDGCWRVHFGSVPLGLIDLRRAVNRNARRFGLLVKLPSEQRRRRRSRRR